MRAKRLASFLVALVLIVVAAILVIHQSEESNWTLEKFYSQELNWQECYEDFECSSFKVPVNYQEINDRTFTLEVLRHRATKPAARIGSIVVNPGGPGGSATDYAYNARSIVSDEINQKFDIVGFDPRGVNESEPIRCLSNQEEDAFLEAGTTRADKLEIRALVGISKNFAVKCADAAGEKLGHYSTYEAAKDLDILRELLGDMKLNYLGKSYGTYLGTIYAALFPKKVGRLVLDGAVAPEITLRDQGLAQAIGFDGALKNYLNSQDQFKLSDIERMLEKAKSEPMRLIGKTDEERTATQSLIITAIAQSLYNSVTGWRELTEALNLAINKNNPKLIFKLSDRYNDRDESGNYYSNQTDISIMITCLDWREERTVADMAEDQEVFRESSSVFGPYLSFSTLPCKYWQAKPNLPEVELFNIQTDPVLIIGVTQDPATPYLWAENLTESFVNAKLLTLKGEGHTGHGRGNKCIDQTVNRFFLTGKSPSKALFCTQSGN